MSILPRIGTRLANRLRSLTTVTTGAISSTRNWFNSNMIPKFELQPVYEQSVYDLLRQLKVNKAIGLDEISPRLLQDSAHVITPSITRLFNRSLANKTFPSTLQKTHNLFWPDENSIEQCCAATLFKVVNNIVQHCYT